MSGKKKSSALEFLDSLIEESPKVQRTARRERLRLELARFMKKARRVAGLTQKEVAEILSVSQSWVSKLESPNFDHKLESVLSYFDAIGGAMNLSVDVAETTFQIWGEAPIWNVLMEPLDIENWGYPISSGVVEHVSIWWNYESMGTSDTHPDHTGGCDSSSIVCLPIDGVWEATVQ